jgi:hypothetical protein
MGLESYVYKANKKGNPAGPLVRIMIVTDTPSGIQQHFSYLHMQGVRIPTMIWLSVMKYMK